ncbi:MAG: DNA cytosine methyltransferase [Clostridia bacterium]|nr:DNA cytosine methyltransferase [Clostridia bacterium]
MSKLTSIEICAGAGGQALGLEMAGFEHLALVEIDKYACATLRKNRPEWNVIEKDVREFFAKEYQNVDLLAGGVPCPPFSVAGNQLGADDNRDLFPEMIRLISECNPKAVMIENVKGLLDTKFEEYRMSITNEIENLGYSTFWNLLNACDYGVSQLRPRTLLIALKQNYADEFRWPLAMPDSPKTVGEALYHEMSMYGWEKAEKWKVQANAIAPTLVGGSKKHGGPDLGPTRSRKAWAKLGVEGKSIADEPPASDFIGNPRLTVKMAAILQGFPVEWEFVGRKTPTYRQIGNAFPPPVAKAVGNSINTALQKGEDQQRGVA